VVRQGGLVGRRARAVLDARDYIRLERALLRGGELDGERILSEQTVDAAFSNQIGELDFPASIPTADPPITDDFNAGPGWKWGHGLLLNTEDFAGGRKADRARGPACSTRTSSSTRTTGICASIYTNSLPFVSRDDTWKLAQDFEAALYSSL